MKLKMLSICHLLMPEAKAKYRPQMSLEYMLLDLL